LTRLILHVGHPKTGTTTLQYALLTNRRRLARKGICYPAIEKEYKHSLLIPHLLKTEKPDLCRRLKISPEQLAERSRRAWSQICASTRDTATDLVIISAEGFWGRGSSQEIAWLCSSLREIADEIHLVAYLRSPDQLFLSRLNQKMRKMRKLPRVMEGYYRKSILSCASGKFDRISLRVFDRSQLAKSDIVSDFIETFVPELTEGIDRSKIRRTNESVSTEAMALLQELKTSNGFASGLPARRLRGRVDRLVRTADAALEGATRPSLHRPVSDAIIARSADLLWLRDQHGITFPDVDYSRVGAPSKVDLDACKDVRDFCPVQDQRLQKLREAVSHALADADI